VLNDGRFPFYSGYTPATGGVFNLLDPASLEVVTASGSACFRGFPSYSDDGSRVFCQGPAVGRAAPLYSASARTSGPATLVAAAVENFRPDATGSAVLYVTSGSIYLAGVATPIASGLSPSFGSTVNGMVVLDTPVVGTTTTYTAALVDFSGTRRPLGAGWSSLTVYSDRTHVKLVADHPGTGARDVQVANAVTFATTTLRPAVCFDAFVGDRLVVIEASDTAAPRLASLPLPGVSGAALGLGLASCSPGVFLAPGSTRATFFRTFDSASGTGSLAQASVDGTSLADLTTVASTRRLGDRLTYLGSYDAASGTGELRSLDLVSGGVTAHLGRVSRYVSTSAATLVGLRSGSPPPYGFQDGLYRIDLP